jgi:Zn-dependent peptidase ImmA (M78 family)
MSFRNVIEGTGLTIEACADVLGVDRELFQQWSDGQKEIPPAYAVLLAAILGVRSEILLAKSREGSVNAGNAGPAAIWFKFRGSSFHDADRETILLMRRLGHNANQLEKAVRGGTNRTWEILFEEVRKGIDYQAAPQEQGREAARVFSELTQFGQGGTGCSEILRDSLRSRGILLIESPIYKSRIEGCSFYVGEGTSQRPCLFVNNYTTTWFRRNLVIMHELGHAIFDQTNGGEIDVAEDEATDQTLRISVSELRAQTFAKETLLSKSILLPTLNRNRMKAASLTPIQLATLISETGIEQRTIVEIMLERGMIDNVLADTYLAYDVWGILKSLTDHALSTREYINKIGKKAAAAWTNKRFTTTSARRLLLPVPYVKAVLDAVRGLSISTGRACELLMIDQYTFSERYPEMELAE